jgi:hypothetical protein
MYIDILRHLRDAVRRKRPEKLWINNSVAAVWMEEENGHATLLALLCYLYGQM